MYNVWLQKKKKLSESDKRKCKDHLSSFQENKYYFAVEKELNCYYLKKNKEGGTDWGHLKCSQKPKCHMRRYGNEEPWDKGQ